MSVFVRNAGPRVFTPTGLKSILIVIDADENDLKILLGVFKLFIGVDEFLQKLTALRNLNRSCKIGI